MACPTPTPPPEVSPLSSGTDWKHVYGFPSPNEVWNASGIGVAGAHWIPVHGDANPAARVASMPFGRPVNEGYFEGLRKHTEITSPARLIWFGDGGSGTTASWGDDNWWIKFVAPGLEDNPGFDRSLQIDYGCERHSGKANYAFADGHAARLNSHEIRCDQAECWWSVRLDFHRRAAP